MKVTFILKNLTDVFYDGNGSSVIGLNNMVDKDKFMYLAKKHDLPVSMKIGNGSFRDKVDLNQMLRNECIFEYKLEPRRGYKLATFIIKRI